MIRFEWDTGQVTITTYPELTISVRPAGETVIILTGDVIGGLFSGGTMILQVTLINYNPLDCLLGQVETLSGLTEVAFVDD